MKTLKIIFHWIAFLLFMSLALVSCEKPEDVTPPELKYLEPYSMASDVSVHTEIIACYDEPVVADNLDFSLEVIGSAYENLYLPKKTVEAEVSIEGCKVILTPADSLWHNAKFAVHLAGEISDFAGNTVEENRSWEFSTVSEFVHPYLVSISPKDGAGNVPIDTKVIVEFSEPVIADTSNLYLIRPFLGGSEKVATEISMEGSKCILTPVELLWYNTEYWVSIGDKITDLAGNPIRPVNEYRIFFITVEGESQCEPHGLDWNRTFGGKHWDCAESVQQTTDGGYILAGYTDPLGSGNYDALLIKTDVAGVKQWSQTFGGSNVDRICSVQQTTDGGYVLTGATRSFSEAGGGDVWLIKTDATGNEQWTQTFGGVRDDRAKSVQQTADGGYILTGWTESWATSGRKVWLIKTDAEGVEQWDQTFSNSVWDCAESVQQTTDGGYILVGTTYQHYGGKTDAWLIKTDATGVEQWNWNRTFGDVEDDKAYSVQQTTDGNYIFAGYTRSHGAGGSDAWLVKIDTVGAVYWNRTFGGAEDDGVYSVQQTTDGGYILAGLTKSYGAGRWDAWLIKTDMAGVEQWTQTFGSCSVDLAYSVQQTIDGGYILAGYTCFFGREENWNDAWLIKVGR